MLQKLNQCGDCLIWTGAVTPDGYPRVNRKGNENTRGHRYFWEEIHGKIPDGLVVLHLCDNPLCLNIDHLKIGTVRENMEDRCNKGRTYNHRSQEEVDKAHSLRKKGLTYKQIAETLQMKTKAVEYLITKKQPSVV